jgi:hypothetical protein
LGSKNALLHRRLNIAKVPEPKYKRAGDYQGKDENRGGGEGRPATSPNPQQQRK